MLPLESHDEYADGTDKRMDGRTDARPLHYAFLDAAIRNKRWRWRRKHRSHDNANDSQFTTRQYTTEHAVIATVDLIAVLPRYSSRDKSAIDCSCYHVMCIKPRPYKQQCPSNMVECYKFHDSFDNVECCFDIVAVFGNNIAGFGNNVEPNFVVSTKSKQIEHVQFVSTLSKGRNFVRHCFRLWQQSRMLLRQSRT